ncbi:MAG: hypothetical protein H8D34_01835 [Chloroflexi bacterium]|nr:hypothetical protein [Chloroflexota bacterium]
MRRKNTSIIVALASMLVACALLGQSTTANKIASQPQFQPAQATGSPCGDGKCRGPENPQNCPVDCSQTEEDNSQTQPGPDPAGIGNTLTLPPLESCPQALCLYTSLSLLKVQDRALEENVLKLFSSAADPTRNAIIPEPDFGLRSNSPTDLCRLPDNRRIKDLYFGAVAII